jgi:hypothetical protein
MAQFAYKYQITTTSGECIFPALTFESMLGLGGIGWDSIAKADKETFVGDFLRIDTIMRKICE